MLLFPEPLFYPRHDLIVVDQIALAGLCLAFLNLLNEPRVVVQKAVNRFLNDLSSVLSGAGGSLP
ncbi:MAG: hypothetical protein ACJ71W_06670 [Terriglobales bacterium]